MTLREYIETMESEEKDLIKEDVLNEGLKIFKLSEKLARAIKRVENKKMPEDVDKAEVARCVSELKKFQKSSEMLEDKYEGGTITRSQAKTEVKKLLAKIKIFSKNAKKKLDVKILKKTGLTIAITAVILLAIGFAVYFGVANGMNLTSLGPEVNGIISKLETAGREVAKAAPGKISDISGAAKDTAAAIGGAAKSAAGAVGGAAKSAAGAAKDATGDVDTVKIGDKIKDMFKESRRFFEDFWRKR